MTADSNNLQSPNWELKLINSHSRTQTFLELTIKHQKSFQSKNDALYAHISSFWAIYAQSLVKTAVGISDCQSKSRFYCLRSLYGCSLLIHLIWAGSSERWCVKMISESPLLHWKFAIVSIPGVNLNTKCITRWTRAAVIEVNESVLEHHDSGTLRPI